MSMTIDMGAALAALNRLVLANHGTWLAHIGQYEKQEIEHRIGSTKTDPDGNHWAPWTDSTALKRARKGNADQGLLWDTGALLESQTFASELGGHLEIGTDQSYAHFLQDGTVHMAARPFVGWTESDLAYLETSFAAHLNALIG